MPRRRSWGLALLAASLLAAAGGWWLTRPPAPPVEASLSVAAAMGGDETGYARALTPRPFVFPADHGPHPEFRTEWWYYTGNLSTAAGRRFGFQLTFFRNRLDPPGDETARASQWASEEVWMAHFAVTDVAAGRFHAHDRFARGALGLAGATAEPFRVWLEDWQGAALPGADGMLPTRLTAAAGEVALDLVLEAGKPPVLQGEDGLSQKGPEAGNASYYYSLTRLPASGTVRTGGEEHPVSGLAWMDREWSTSALAAGLVGWDWFSLQLDDGRELMVYQLRRDDGTAHGLSSGTLVDRRGRSQTLTANDFEVEVLERWRSPASGILYPARWRLRVPEAGWTLTVEPLLAGQELELAFRYWEGAVTVSGRGPSGPVAGYGYVELTGYGEEESLRGR